MDIVTANALFMTKRVHWIGKRQRSDAIIPTVFKLFGGSRRGGGFGSGLAGSGPGWVRVGSGSAHVGSGLAPEHSRPYTHPGNTTENLCLDVGCR